MGRAVRRALLVGVATAVTLAAWGVLMAGIASGAAPAADEHANRWTPLVVGPIVAVYCWTALGALGALGGGWRLWRWTPAVVLAGAILGLVVQAGVVEAGRAYEPELIWWPLFLCAPFAPAVATIAAARRRRD
jgi:hypothetical protein